MVQTQNEVVQTNSEQKNAVSYKDIEIYIAEKKAYLTMNGIIREDTKIIECLDEIEKFTSINSKLIFTRLGNEITLVKVEKINPFILKLKELTKNQLIYTGLFTEKTDEFLSIIAITVNVVLMYIMAHATGFLPFLVKILKKKIKIADPETAQTETSLIEVSTKEMQTDFTENELTNDLSNVSNETNELNKTQAAINQAIFCSCFTDNKPSICIDCTCVKNNQKCWEKCHKKSAKPNCKNS